MKRLSSLLSLLCATLLTASPPAALAEVTVINRSTGERLPVYRHHNRLYVEGKANDRYSVELRNLTGARILTTVSVDGVNVITGQTAATSQSGYVLNPWARAEISGWRKDMSEVAAFYFTRLPDSYAARTSRPANVGVIGVAVYREYVEPYRPMMDLSLQKRMDARQSGQSGSSVASGRLAANDSMTNAPAAAPAEQPARAKAMAEEKIGTGHGERIQAPTAATEFRRGSDAPAEVIAIYYDTRANLIAQGIIPSAPRLAQPFPRGVGFVPDPS